MEKSEVFERAAKKKMKQWDWVDLIIPTAIITPIGLFILILILHIKDRNSPILAELKKDSWTCTSSHSEISYTFINTGKIMIQQPIVNNVCDRYERVK